MQKDINDVSNKLDKKSGELSSSIVSSMDNLETSLNKSLPYLFQNQMGQFFMSYTKTLMNTKVVSIKHGKSSFITIIDVYF